MPVVKTLADFKRHPVMRTSSLDEMGDMDAPRGSRAWSIWVRDSLNTQLHDAEFASDMARSSFNALRESEGWRTLNGPRESPYFGRPFQSFESFCTCRKPFGLGYSIEHIEAVIRETAERQKQAADLAKPGEIGRGRNGNRGYNVTPKRGNNADYWAARIKRDHPEIAARVERGEFKSMRAAAIAAGIVKPKTALDLLRAAWKKATPAERDSFLRDLPSGSKNESLSTPEVVLLIHALQVYGGQVKREPRLKSDMLALARKMREFYPEHQ
jgi:hypothetical protein